jgi:hypothetical protein
MRFDVKFSGFETTMEDEDLVLSVAHVLIEELLISWYNGLLQHLHLLRI